MYREYSDYEILYMIKDNNDGYEIMINKYRPLVIKICEQYQSIFKTVGYERDDIIQIANIALVEAIDAYEEQKDVLFYTFCNQCIKNRLKNELRNQQTNKKKMLNQVVSYNRVVNNQELVASLPDINAIDPYEEVLFDEFQTKYIEFINSLPFDMAIAFELKQNGFSSKEISILSAIDLKTIIKYLRQADRYYLSKFSKYV